MLIFGQLIIFFIIFALGNLQKIAYKLLRIQISPVKEGGSGPIFSESDGDFQKVNLALSLSMQVNSTFSSWYNWGGC